MRCLMQEYYRMLKLNVISGIWQVKSLFHWWENWSTERKTWPEPPKDPAARLRLKPGDQPQACITRDTKRSSQPGAEFSSIWDAVITWTALKKQLLVVLPYYTERRMIAGPEPMLNYGVPIHGEIRLGHGPFILLASSLKGNSLEQSTGHTCSPLIQLLQLHSFPNWELG